MYGLYKFEEVICLRYFQVFNPNTHQKSYHLQIYEETPTLGMALNNINEGEKEKLNLN